MAKIRAMFDPLACTSPVQVKDSTRNKFGDKPSTVRGGTQPLRYAPLRPDCVSPASGSMFQDRALYLRHAYEHKPFREAPINDGRARLLDKQATAILEGEARGHSTLVPLAKYDATKHAKTKRKLNRKV